MHFTNSTLELVLQERNLDDFKVKKTLKFLARLFEKWIMPSKKKKTYFLCFFKDKFESLCIVFQ